MVKVGFQEAFQVWLRQEINNSDINVEGLYSTWAEKDSEFPYLVYKLENNSYLNDRIITQATLMIDIWDYSQLERGVLQIREQLVALLENRLVDEEEIASIYDSFQDYDGTGVVSAIRINLRAENPIPTDTQNVWRRELQFSVRYDRRRDLQIVNRGD